MNVSQRQVLLDLIQQFEQCDFEKPLANKYKNAGPLEGVVVADIPVLDVLALCRRSFEQLKKRLEAEAWQILPNTQILPEYGQGALNICLQQIINSLNTADYNQAAQSVKALILYQTQNGFWNLPIDKSLSQQEMPSYQMDEKIRSLSEIVAERQKMASALLDELNQGKNDLNLLKQNLTSQFASLSKNKSEADLILTNLKNTEKNASALENVIQQNQEKSKTIIDKLLSAQESVEKQENQLQVQIEKANDQLKNIDDILKNSLKGVTENFEKTSSSVEEIQKMMGYIADGTLSHSFNLRKKNIKKTVNFWLWTSLVLFIAAIGWIVFVFSCLKANTGVVWADILINAVKSSLAVFAFGYALNEYGKERNLQEEYAFKESVAITLTAYLERLDSCDKDEMKELLIDTVTKLYEKPVMSNKEWKFGRIKSKDISDSVKILIDSIRKLAEK